MTLAGSCIAQMKMPECPAGSQLQRSRVSGKPYIRYECKLPEKTNNVEMCREWEGTDWNKTESVPCGSRVSFTVEYTGPLNCSVGEQVYLWDRITNKLSKEISCLPRGWAVTQMTGDGCPKGFVVGTPALFGQDNCYGPKTVAIGQHDLLAHNINGFSLDMTVKQVQTLATQPLQPLGGGQFKVTSGDVEYDFGFSILGHLYRIDSDQKLGRFVPDEAFASSLTRKMTAKFGPPQLNELPSGPLSWDFLERYREPNGPVLNRETLSLSALLMGGYGQPITLHLKLMDFRITRRDLAMANAAPRSRAEEKTEF